MHAETCAYNLSVPTVHATYEEFKQYFFSGLQRSLHWIWFGLATFNT